MGLLKQIVELNSSGEVNQTAEIDTAIDSAILHISEFTKDSSMTNVNLLMIGGASLHVNGLRGNFADIDLMVDGIELSPRMDQHAFECPKTGMSLEIFYQNKITTINDPKMFERSPEMISRKVNGIDYSVSCYPPEYFLFMKMEMGRDKCQKDIQVLLQNIPQGDILRAFNELAKHNEDWVMSDMADMLITDLIMLNMPGSSMGDETPSLVDFCKELDVDPKKKKEITMMCKIVEIQNKKKIKPRSVDSDCLSI